MAGGTQGDQAHEYESADECYCYYHVSSDDITDNDASYIIDDLEEMSGVGHLGD